MKNKGFFLILILVVAWLAPATAKADVVGTLELTSPFSKSYVANTDFATFVDNNFFGSVTAPIQLVPGLGYDADFANFVPGRIALIQRGTIYFSDKVNNAWEAGAVGALIFDPIDQPLSLSVTLQDPTNIPSLFVSHSVGEELVDLWAASGATVHLAVTNAVPEPATMLLLGLGLVGLAGVRRVKK